MSEEHEGIAESASSGPMAIEVRSTPVRSRRAVIAAGLGGLAAFAANALGRPKPVQGANGGAVVLAAFNDETSVTVITNSGSGAAFGAISGDSTGVGGVSSSGRGLDGQSTSGHGVHGASSSSYGIYGTTASGAAGILGYNAGNDGVVGSSAAPAHSGVWGTNTGGGYGVSGSTGGASTAGVWGINSGTGIGVRATSASGIALRVEGKASFSRSGKTKILAGHSSKAVSLSGVTGASLIFAVLASNRSGRFVRAVVPGSGAFTIYLNTTVLSDTYLSWFVLN